MLTRKQQPPTPNSQSGFTIIESLSAIMVVAILLTAVAPVIVFSVATRVQARRVEQATQAARAYVDALRSGALKAPLKTVYLNEVNTDGNFVSQRNTFSQQPAPDPASLQSCVPPATPDPNNPYPYCDTTLSLYCVNLDDTLGCASSSNKDLIIQAIRSTTVDPTSIAAGSTPPDDSGKGYILSFRVYRADGFADGTPLRPTPADIQAEQSNPGSGNIGKSQSGVTSGMGDRKSPLYEITTEIVGGETTYKDFCDRLGGCQTTTTNPPANPGGTAQ